MTISAGVPGSECSVAAVGWQEIASKKRALRDVAVRTFKNADDVDTAITAIDDASALVEALASGQLTAEAVTRAYIQQAIEAHENTNCLTEVCFAEAIDRAITLDKHLATTGSPYGPLHGMPISLKDQFDVKGLDTTLGYVGRSFAPAEADCVLVQMFKSMGAIVICKTNIPQSIMWCETDNPLFGLTTNPTDKRYTPGGSTGGEAALLSCRGSVLGLGTDIGGSIRIPSHMMGLYGFKPSSARLPYRGVQVSTDGQEHVPSSVGPMARSLKSIELTMRSLSNARPWTRDPKCAPIPWRQDAYDEIIQRPLVLAVLINDGVVQPHAPVARTLQHAVEILRSAGHQVFEWDASLHQDAIEVMDAYYTADGGEDIVCAVSAGGEPYIPHVEKLLKRGDAISVFEYWQLNRRKRSIQHAYLDKWQNFTLPSGEKVVADALIMPPMPHSAVPHGSCRWVGYTKVWNLMDYPALVIPGGRVGDFSKDCPVPVDRKAEAVNSHGGELDALNRALWEEKGDEMATLNLPIGIQIIGQKLEEERVLGVGKVLDDLLRKSKTT
ncbi:acetamidase [Microdochium trichocladiopsis]|uniref:Acetamidase n=1 Tax=Microdochium trichocladiopsis TaxID=1682393 RepID=A0A9P9BVJ9_9PEZI|nr:acetamidase [Microdochium trichocladiopsis]KAH7039822.1 acetamidase [Microdochium trichocladiopsis]